MVVEYGPLCEGDVPDDVRRRRVTNDEAGGPDGASVTCRGILCARAQIDRSSTRRPRACRAGREKRMREVILALHEDKARGEVAFVLAAASRLRRQRDRGRGDETLAQLAEGLGSATSAPISCWMRWRRIWAGSRRPRVPRSGTGGLMFAPILRVTSLVLLAWPWPLRVTKKGFAPADAEHRLPGRWPPANGPGGIVTGATEHGREFRSAPRTTASSPASFSQTAAVVDASCTVSTAAIARSRSAMETMAGRRRPRAA